MIHSMQAVAFVIGAAFFLAAFLRYLCHRGDL